jgi:hypothetical protein
MGNSASLYDVRLDGEIVTNLPKSLYEPLQALMSGHQSLIILRKPEIIERDIQIDDNADIIDESVKRLEEAINLQRTQITEVFNSTISEFNNQVKDLKLSLNEIANQPQNDTSSIKTMIELLAGNVTNTLNTLPLTLHDKFNNQTDRLIESINDTLRPKDSLNVTIKGAAYEQEVTQQFESLGIDTLSIEHVSTTNHVCDIHVIDTNNDILYAVECKNYTNTVGRDQLKKFESDLENLRTIHTNKTVIGLFLSKQTRIVEHGMFDIDSDGNVYLAGDYNTPNMWRALIMYFGKLKNKNRLINQPNADNEEHIRVLTSVYYAMKDIEPLSNIIATNIQRVNDMLKDLQTMSAKIKPLSELIDQYDKLYHFEQKPKKAQRSKKAKNEPVQVQQEPEQLDISPSALSFSDSDEEEIKIEPKAKKLKVNKKEKPAKIKQEKTHIMDTVKVIQNSINWSDDD